MTRDEILEVLTTLRDNCDVDANNAWDRGSAIIAWLERLPAGCDLAGWRGGGRGSGLGSGLVADYTIYDDDVKRGTSYIVRAVCMNPADEVTDET